MTIDTWIPNYRELGITKADAERIAAECERRQAGGDERDWTEILSEVAQEIAPADIKAQ